MNLSGWFLKNESKFCIESMQKIVLTDNFYFTKMGSDFIRKAKRLTVLMNSSCKSIGR